MEGSSRSLREEKKSGQLPTFPLLYKSSIIGLEELNFRVRYGTGCDLFSIATQALYITVLQYHVKTFQEKTFITMLYCL